MIITNPSGYQIMLNVYGIYHYIIKKGQKVIFNLAQNPKTFYATVTSITPVINPETETFYVHAKPIKNYKELTEGAYVSAQILSNNQKVYAIEKNAVVTNNSEKFVYIQIKPFTYKKIIVQTALENDKYIQIVNFKKLLGKKIVISGANYIFAKEQFLND
jgi:cold shock CspA family protein